MDSYNLEVLLPRCTKAVKAVAWHMRSRSGLGRGCGDRMETGFSWYLDNETTYSRRVVCPSLNGRKCVRDDFEVRNFFGELSPFQLDAYCIEDFTLTGIPFRPEGLGNAMMRVSVIPSVMSCRPVSGCLGNKRVRTRIHDLPPCKPLATPRSS